jgi:hypothetical protein
MTRYRQGYEFERRTRLAFEADGYVVWRPGGSKSPADLIAAKPGQLVLIQVKKGEAPLADGWWNDLHRMAAWLNAIPVVADWPKSERKGKAMELRLRRITGPHSSGSRLWPCRQFLMDEVEAASRWDTRNRRARPG